MTNDYKESEHSWISRLLTFGFLYTVFYISFIESYTETVLVMGLDYRIKNKYKHKNDHLAKLNKLH